MLEYVILGMLIEGPMSGYDLKKTIDSTVGFFYKVSFGSLYPALKRLAAKEWVTVTEMEDSKNKKLYTLLPVGKEAFLIWLAGPLELSRNDHLSKIFFFDYLDEETRQRRLTEYQSKLEGQITQITAVQQIVSGELQNMPNPENYHYRVSVLTYGLEFYNMEKRWVQAIQERNDH
ncbi:PadR family transcriptional regulator [Paenibacillus crassostreae]|uniref:PadR family transcriptional regulator n=1 Tax=Paenibacillus crassostreae TaxID=1763538 RepID=A0A167EGH1_9BACL|nr:PadR family transcriptional regulator [Paenibacillus crassostreae]AOZ92603.1 PadR family transcriptional regulator [Paenibacillus crassostreae]OAB75528.1 PadR family transcriptional regulator [Paenibacillus crassostreae]